MQSQYTIQQKQLIKKIRDSVAKKKFEATIVNLQKDYENDDKICLTSSASIPKNIAQKIIREIITPLKNIDPNHFYCRPEIMHLTIKNVRIENKPQTFTNKDIIKVDQLFKELISKFPSLTFHLEDLLLFPTSISLIGYCDEKIKKLIQTLDVGLEKIGVPDDKKYFSNKVFFNNITVCRFTNKPTKEFLKKLKELDSIKIGKLQVTKINLMTCNAANSPKTKKIIGTYKLRSRA